MKCLSHGMFLRLGVAVLVMTSTGVFLPPVFAEEFNWRALDGANWLTPVKSQFGGTCWDFSACGTIEAKYKLTRNDYAFNPNISEQQVCWETDPDMGSTGGGWGYKVLNYSVTHGIVSEAECPHQSSSEDVGIVPYWPLADGWEDRVWKSISYQRQITTSTSATKTYLKTLGPLHVGVGASNDLYSSPTELINNYRSPTSTLDHEVVLVGFVDDTRVPTGGYWIIKNSWGTGGGDGGYYYVPYGNIEYHNDTNAITSPVFYTGAMATATWTGTWNSTWSTTGYFTPRNWSKDGANYRWVNQETQAIFDSTADESRRSITINGTAIAHGLTFSAAGYSISSGALTVTGGGITADESVTI
ncbi:MAG: hypothetical protein JW765_02520, partial [Deltaproteobacteria bacterium]|nr:hypothetical protein [Candidatus Zymogenaceae bacterium]